MSSRPPEPTQEELEEAGKYESDRPGGVIYKDGKAVTVKRKPTEEEKKERKRIERKREKEHREAERRERKERAREEAEKVSIPRKEFEEPTPRLKPSTELPSIREPPIKGIAKPDVPDVDDRLDEQPYPGEPTFVERLHGVERDVTPPPKFVKDIGRFGRRYEELLGLPSRRIRERATGTLARAEEAKFAGKDVEAGFLFGTYMFQRTIAGGWEMLTLPARPEAMYKTVRTGVGLIVDPKVRKAMVESAKADPGGFTAELAGGILGGTIVGGALRRMGLVKPSSYRLKPTTKAREITSPATKMPTGKYPTGAFDTKLWKMGGTPILAHKDPSLMIVYEPVPVYKPSLIEPGVGLLSGLRPFTVSEEKPITKMKAESVVSIPRGYLDIVQRTEPWRKPSVRRVTEEALILKPVVYTERKPRPLVYPRITTTQIPTTITKTRTRTREKQIQEQALIQTLKVSQVPPQLTRLKPLKMDLILEEEKTKKVKRPSFKAVTEVRLRPIKPPRLKK